jgi:hypothetical protein
MFDLLKIKLFGHQPAAKISDQLLNRLIERDFKSNVDIVTTKFRNINSVSQEKNRIAAGILKLANKKLDDLDKLIETANEDYRDIMMRAEYPRCAKIGFGALDKKQKKKVYCDDFIEYSNWLKG